MANTLITKNSSTAAAIPTAGQLVQGELAVNVTDKRVFTENSGGAVVELGINPSSLTLASGTANGVTYLNGSKVLTSGSALTFDGSTLTTTAGIEGTKLTTAGNISLYNSSSSQLTHYQQLSSSYTASYIQSALSGASSSLVFAVNSNWTNGNAAEQMRLTSTGLGIGTTVPNERLTVNSAAAASARIGVQYNGSTIAFLGSYSGIVGSGNATDMLIGATNALAFASGGAGTERMRLDSSGNLGLGVTPSGWYVAGANARTFQINNASFYADTNNGVSLASNWLFDSAGAQKYLSNGYATRFLQTAGQYQWLTAPSGTAGNAISFTQAMTLDASGSLLVSATVNDNSANNLYVRGSQGFASGATTLATAATKAAVRFQGSSDSSSSIFFGVVPTDANQYLQVANTNGSQAADLSLNPFGGNVGIGTSSPTDNLDVKGGITISTAASLKITGSDSTSSQGVVRFYRGGAEDTTGSYAGFRTGGDGANGVAALLFDVASSERMRIDSAGNVGIGTSSPNYRLDVAGTANAVALGTTLAYGVSGEVYSSFRFNNSSFAGGNSEIRNIVKGSASTGSTLAFLTTQTGSGPLTERLRIDNSGNLLVGTPSRVGSGKLSLLYTSTVDSGIAIRSSVESYNTAIQFLNTAGTQVGTVNTSTTTTAYNTSSDYRLKEDWVAVANASTRVNALKPINFVWKVDGSRVDGFLAHELAEVVPEAVTGTKDAVDVEGKPVYQGIDQSKLVPLLTAALQEALAKIESLEARLDAANI